MHAIKAYTLLKRIALIISLIALTMSMAALAKTGSGIYVAATILWLVISLVILFSILRERGSQ